MLPLPDSQCYYYYSIDVSKCSCVSVATIYVAVFRRQAARLKTATFYPLLGEEEEQKPSPSLCLRLHFREGESFTNGAGSAPSKEANLLKHDKSGKPSRQFSI